MAAEVEDATAAAAATVVTNVAPGATTARVAVKSRGGGREGGGGGGRGQNRRNVLKVKRTHREEWIASLAEGRRPVAEQLMHEGRDGVSGALARQNKAALIAGRDAIDIGPIMKIADALLPALAISEWRDTA